MMHLRPFQVALSDGSICQVEPVSRRESLVTRLVGGEPVWVEQIEGLDPQVALEALVGAMATQPVVFFRFSVTDAIPLIP